MGWLYRCIVIVISLVVLLSCSSDDNGQHAVFDYEDFGPQSVAWETLGYQWWQWQKHADSDHAVTYPVKVVIYRGMHLDQVKSRFPVDASKQQDFRYISYAEAIAYLNRNIEETRQSDELWMKQLREKLISTRDRIRAALE